MNPKKIDIVWDIATYRLNWPRGQLSENVLKTFSYYAKQNRDIYTEYPGRHIVS